MSQPGFAFVGGGSGGDAYPLLTVARALRRQRPGIRALFFSTVDGIEGGLYAEAGFPVETVPALRLYPRNLPRLPFVLARGTWRARRALSAFGPSALLSLGGFVSPPVALAARSLGVPVLLLEPNCKAGRANRALARLAARVVTAYPEAAATFPDPGRVRCLGFPLRYRYDPELQAQRRLERPEARLTLGIVGGSLGARILNDTAVAAYPRLAAVEGLRVVHVAGRRDFSRVQQAWEQAGAPGNIEVREYQLEMDLFYDQCDLLLSRAGGMTCAELIEFELPSLLVPLAIAPGDHQAGNAAPLVACGGAELVREPEFSPERLLAWVEAALADPDALTARRLALGGLRRPDAADQVAGALLELAGLDAPLGAAEGAAA